MWIHVEKGIHIVKSINDHIQGFRKWIIKHMDHPYTLIPTPLKYFNKKSKGNNNLILNGNYGN